MPVSPSNPFFHRGPVREPAYFFGRESERGFLAELLRNRQHIALSGARRLGKTSLLFNLAHPLVAQQHDLAPPHTHWAYIDAAAIDGLDETYLYGAIAQALGAELAQLSYPQLVELLRTRAAQATRLIVLLDEFEALATNRQLGPEVFNRLRGLATTLPLQYVTAAKDPLVELTFAHPETLSSPFFNIFAPLQLGLFAPHAARTLLAELSARAGLPFAAPTIDALLALAGPHPLFVQVAGYRAFAALQPGGRNVLTPAEWAGVATASLADLEPHLRYYWNSLHPAEQYALATLPLFDNQAQLPALERLRANGLVQANGYLGQLLEAFVRRQTVDGVFQAGPLLLDRQRGLAAVGNQRLHLTPTEYLALSLFLSHPGELITPETIEAALWPGEYSADPERARGVVKKLRAALGPAANLIVNRRGQGYLLDTSQ